MDFSKEQLAAMFKLASCMVAADGKVMPEESKLVLLEAMAQDTGSDHSPFELAQALPLERVSDIIVGMNTTQKKYMCGFLAAVMAADGNVDENELALWTMTTILCGCPYLSIEEAVNYWKSH